MGSSPTPGTIKEPPVAEKVIVNFGIWLLQRGNRESTIERKLRYLKILHGSPQDMILQILSNPWVDKNKCNALNMVYQFAEFLEVPVQKAKFKVYDNKEMYVPNPVPCKPLSQEMEGFIVSVGDPMLNILDTLSRAENLRKKEDTMRQFLDKTTR